MEAFISALMLLYSGHIKHDYIGSRIASREHLLHYENSERSFFLDKRLIACYHISRRKAL